MPLANQKLYKNSKLYSEILKISFLLTFQKNVLMVMAFSCLKKTAPTRTVPHGKEKCKHPTKVSKFLKKLADISKKTDKKVNQFYN